MGAVRMGISRSRTPQQELLSPPYQPQQQRPYADEDESEDSSEFSEDQESEEDNRVVILPGNATTCPGILGLENLGNTCYFNSTIQALRFCPPFAAFFRSAKDVKPLVKKEPYVSVELARTFEILSNPNSQKTKHIPSKLIGAFRDMAPSFRNHSQQDAQECMRSLIEILHKELEQPSYQYSDQFRLRTSTDPFEKIGTDDDMEFDDQEVDSRLPGKPPELYDEPVAMRSVVDEIFSGAVEYEITCLNCKNPSTCQDVFIDLSLSLPDRVPNGNGRPNGEHKSTNTGFVRWTRQNVFHIRRGLTLHDCLDNFFEAEFMSGENLYNCERCKSHNEAEKRCRIKKLPEILCFHLKRFHHFGFTGKISTTVEFPLRGLDMSKYAKEVEGTVYDLCSFITHQGTSAETGHYLAFCFNEHDNCWYEFNDAKVSKEPKEKVASRNAYLLFYRRRSSPELESMRVEVQHSAKLPLKKADTCYIPTEWLLKFGLMSNPGVIFNYEHLCRHGCILPRKERNFTELVVPISTETWKMLHSQFGGGPFLNELKECSACSEPWGKLQFIRNHERRLLEQMNYWSCVESKRGQQPMYFRYLPKCVINREWFEQWKEFLFDPCTKPPGKIDNSHLLVEISDGEGKELHLRPNASNGVVVDREISLSLLDIYGGGPEVFHTDDRQPTEEEKKEADVKVSRLTSSKKKSVQKNRQ